jgi:hypothetical protein
MLIVSEGIGELVFTSAADGFQGIAVELHPMIEANRNADDDCVRSIRR